MIDDRIKLLKGDITTLGAEAIVNAANKTLMGGGGVDGAIHKAAGPGLLEECQRIIAKIGECQTGEAVVTSGSNLDSDYIIHTVGPVWQGGTKDEALKLALCYKNSLALAEGHSIKEIAFPNISTGVYGFPKKEAAEIAINTVNKYLKNCISIKRVIFICYDDENFRLYQNILNEEE
jgi:O-acetyl-ADP-ribose deacetylase (regulator of RNase III)